MMTTRALALTAAVLGVACTAASGVDPSDLAGQKPDGGRCAPGDTQPCICLGGGMGAQTCRASGASYGPCGGCGPEEEDGPLPVVQDAGGNPCGDCDGCCEGSTCVPFASQNDTLCGARGATCGSCGSQVCDTTSGGCVTPSAAGCDASNCATGCCKTINGTPTCEINQPQACGTGGGSCTQCTYGVVCSGGCTTMMDGNAMFKVIVTKATFYNTDVGGSCWDNYAGFGCAQPDPKVCFGYQSNGSVIEACTTTLSDVPADSNGIDTATWDQTSGLISSGGSPFLIPASYFIAGGKVRVTVYDVDDFNANDIIGQAYINAQSMYYSAYNLSAFGRVTGITFALR